VGTNAEQSINDSISSLIPQGQNVLQQIFKDHFDDFINQYDEKYAAAYGNYRIDRRTEVVEEFMKCGIYSEGIARVICTKSNCDHEL